MTANDMLALLPLLLVAGTAVPGNGGHKERGAARAHEGAHELSISASTWAD